MPCIYLCTNTLAPAFEGIELGMGDALLMKVLSEATGRQVKDIKADLKEKGDLGEVAEKSRSQQKSLSFGAPPAPLTVRAIFAAFKSIAAEGKHDKKNGFIKKLLVAAKGTEARYIFRGLQGKLRIGLAELTVQVALAHAVTLTSAVATKTAAEMAALDADGGGGGAAAASANPLVVERGEFPPVLLAPRGCAGAGKILSPSGWEALEERLTAATEQFKSVFSELPSYDAIVPHLLREDIAGAARSCHLTPGSEWHRRRPSPLARAPPPPPPRTACKRAPTPLTPPRAQSP